MLSSVHHLGGKETLLAACPLGGALTDEHLLPRAEQVCADLHVDEASDLEQLAALLGSQRVAAPQHDPQPRER